MLGRDRGKASLKASSPDGTKGEFMVLKETYFGEYYSNCNHYNHQSLDLIIENKRFLKTTIENSTK